MVRSSIVLRCLGWECIALYSAPCYGPCWGFDGAMRPTGRDAQGLDAPTLPHPETMLWRPPVCAEDALKHHHPDLGGCQVPIKGLCFSVHRCNCLLAHGRSLWVTALNSPAHECIITRNQKRQSPFTMKGLSCCHYALPRITPNRANSATVPRISRAFRMVSTPSTANKSAHRHPERVSQGLAHSLDLVRSLAS